MKLNPDIDVVEYAKEMGYDLKAENRKQKVRGFVVLLAVVAFGTGILYGSFLITESMKSSIHEYLEAK